MHRTISRAEQSPRDLGRRTARLFFHGLRRELAALDRAAQIERRARRRGVELLAQRRPALAELTKRVPRPPRLRERAHQKLMRRLERRILREDLPQRRDARLEISALVRRLREA